ncbi:H(+)-transporting two-sector ATPase [Kribbella flavida DSM 17836]|uniref:H(+)-transporting two-sector ATPase n=1 Tax=Kribbella flavida (strain DSM 17836 / JCM 10339 / NBRC 14399) TaxID=479435 RepID=D2Q2L6_KRIFD|nr:potassium transporter TrkG [Kribbella flavida]ADB30197.1 H(+)-transporting two-sector ATPase [Kribbella flavida DSM 17836]
MKWRHPGQLVVAGFAAVTAVGTMLLMLPVASTTGESTGVVPALFTAVSAVCVTGLIVVDTPTYWSGFGEGVVLGLIQIGGLGVMTLASVLALLVARRLGMRLQLSAQAETKALGLGDVRQVVGGVIRLSLAVEVVIAILLALRFGLGYGESFGRAVYLGVFHAVSAYNNAGFALYSDSLIGFATDPFICFPIMAAIVLGGLGFPVVLELLRRRRREWRGRPWSLHTRITLATYGGLLVVGTVAVTVVEWRNPATLGALELHHRLLVGLFHGVMPRTAGFNSLDVAQLEPTTLLVNDVLMFIGGGSAGTAGGIKVTTFALLAFVMLAEIRGEPTVHVLNRRLPGQVQRQALTVALLGVGTVMAGTLALLAMTSFKLDDVLFETVSAFGTVGMSTGITAKLPVAGQFVLMALMFIGRLGPVTLASALAIRDRPRRYELPEERPVVG